MNKSGRPFGCSRICTIFLLQQADGQEMIITDTDTDCKRTGGKAVATCQNCRTALLTNHTLYKLFPCLLAPKYEHLYLAHISPKHELVFEIIIIITRTLGGKYIARRSQAPTSLPLVSCQVASTWKPLRHKSRSLKCSHLPRGRADSPWRL